MRLGVVIAGKYRITKELGAGGMGSVWQAVHLVTEREFAIKFLHTSLTTSQGLLQRFFQEAKVSGKLRHPSVIEIFDVGSAVELGGAPFLVMELLDGASMDILLRKAGALPPRIALESVAEASRALALAHDKGIVHRDLKPANIFLHRPGTGAVVPKVLDFGISKIADSKPDAMSTGLTQTGAVLGSPLYMSPEQAASDKTIDGRSDVHALGVVLWECLVGKAPFEADTYNNLVVRIITGDRPRLADALPGVSPTLAHIVEKAMARKREDRYPTASALADALEAEIGMLPPSTSITSRGAAAEIFAKMSLPSLRPEPPETPAGTTTGGISVPSVRRPSDASPIAFTLESSGVPSSVSSGTAFAATQHASVSQGRVAATLVETPMPAFPGGGVASAGPRSRSRVVIGAGITIAATLLFVGVWTMAAHKSPPAAATPGATDTAVASGVTSSAPLVTASAAPPPAPSNSAAAAVATTAATAPTTITTSTAASPRATGGAAGAAPRPRPKKDDSVQSSGF